METMKFYGIQPMAWGPLAEGKFGIFTDDDLVKIGEKYGKTAAQVALRWNVQRGVVIIPKSSKEERMAQNLDIWDFELTEDEMKIIASKDKGHSEIIDHFNPEVVKMVLGMKTASEQIDKTLKMLQVDYLDLLLLHQPYGKVQNAWKACEDAVDSGKVRAIGVCNFTEKDMDKLLEYARIKPVLMQNESHPYHSDKDIVKKYAKYDIRLEAWYPLGHGDKGLLNEAVFDRLAKKYKKSKVQIILRWHMQMNHIAIPGSKNPEHIKSNADIFDFELTDKEMNDIALLDGKKKFFNMPRFLGNILFPNVKVDYDSQQ